jgi:hypothetical protein
MPNCVYHQNRPVQLKQHVQGPVAIDDLTFLSQRDKKCKWRPSAERDSKGPHQFQG